jgi:hypothetical protein
MLMMHQTQRLVSLAEDIEKIRKKDSLRLLFLLISAEAVAKLQDGFTTDGKSHFYIWKFFRDFLSTGDKQRIEAGFGDVDKGSLLSLQEAVDYLSAIRCDVVHEGNYWGFNFSSDGTTTMTAGPTVNIGVRIRYPEFRDMVVRGAVEAIHSKLPT